MNKTIRLIILVFFGILLLVALVIGGMKLSETVEQVHEDNMSNLANFGNVMLPGRDSSTVNEDGSKAIEPSIVESKLSTSDKIIISLSKEKDMLSAELSDARIKLKALEEKVAKLEGKLNSSQVSGMASLDDEKNYARMSIESLLQDSPDAERFDRFQKQAMALASADVYANILKRGGLNISRTQKNELIMEHLPAFAFCIGNSIHLVTNSGEEREEVLDYLKSQGKTEISQEVKADLEAIQSPCLAQLNDRITGWL